MKAPTAEQHLASEYESLIRQIGVLYDRMILIRESLPPEIASEIEGKHGVSSQSPEKGDDEERGGQ